MEYSFNSMTNGGLCRFKFLDFLGILSVVKHLQVPFHTLIFFSTLELHLNINMPYEYKYYVLKFITYYMLM